MPLFEEAIKYCTARLGPDHPDTLRSMFGLANTYIIAGRLEDATSLHQEVFRLRKTRLGPDHPDTLHSMFAVALAYRVDGWIFESIPLFEKALELRRASLGPDHLGTLQSMYGLAAAYQDADRLDDAIRLSEEALELYKAKLGDHPTVLRISAIHAGALGQMRLQQKNYADAERLLRENLSFHEQMMPDNWSRFRSASLLGASLLGQKRYADAEPLLIGAYEGLERPEAKVRPMLKRFLTEAGERVVRLYDEWDKPEKAADWRAKLAREFPTEKNKPRP
jgi:tetratricopeptide (TPR) repeat protein